MTLTDTPPPSGPRAAGPPPAPPPPAPPGTPLEQTQNMGAVYFTTHFPTSCVVRENLHGGKVLDDPQSVTPDCKKFKNCGATCCGVGGTFVVKRVVEGASDMRRRVVSQVMNWGLGAEAAGELGDVAEGKKHKVSAKAKAEVALQFGLRYEVTDEYVVNLVYKITDSNACTTFYAYKNYETGYDVHFTSQQDLEMKLHCELTNGGNTLQVYVHLLPRGHPECGAITHGGSL